MLNLPPGIRSLLLINVAMFALQYLGHGTLEAYFALWPISSGRFQIWQLVTYSFLHDTHTPFHLLFNMLALWMFGSDVERVWGRNRFLTYYFVCVLSAGLTQILFTDLAHSTVETIGASGGVFGLLLAFGMMYPHRTILLIFPPIPMPAWLFVAVYGALELWFGVSGIERDVAHFAHLGGMLGGYLMIRFGRSRRR
ncbi:MAG TPA: rhomboid family intramembrane serine protease [Burkholderiaceae bacterium]|jgi:membrane associated rhomboid family serine protease|nr:rhomboid family intramembrane serine protease [Burkholderiaceae bacterium]